MQKFYMNETMLTRPLSLQEKCLTIKRVYLCYVYLGSDKNLKGLNEMLWDGVETVSKSLI